MLPVRVQRDFRPEHNDYKFGFKHGKCLKLMSDDVKRIQGNFVQDKLEGKVRHESKHNIQSILSYESK